MPPNANGTIWVAVVRSKQKPLQFGLFPLIYTVLTFRLLFWIPQTEISLHLLNLTAVFHAEINLKKWICGYFILTAVVSNFALQRILGGKFLDKNKRHKSNQPVTITTRNDRWKQVHVQPAGGDIVHGNRGWNRPASFSLPLEHLLIWQSAEAILQRI